MSIFKELIGKPFTVTREEEAIKELKAPSDEHNAIAAIKALEDELAREFPLEPNTINSPKGAQPMNTLPPKESEFAPNPNPEPSLDNLERTLKTMLPKAKSALLVTNLEDKLSKYLVLKARLKAIYDTIGEHVIEVDLNIAAINAAQDVLAPLAIKNKTKDKEKITKEAILTKDQAKTPKEAILTK